MKVEISKKEAKELYEKTGKLKYRILSEMVEDTKEDLERKVRERVNQLLKEIEQEKERYKEVPEVIAGLCIAEEKIKKAFSGVLRE